MEENTHVLSVAYRVQVVNEMKWLVINLIGNIIDNIMQIHKDESEIFVIKLRIIIHTKYIICIMLFVYHLELVLIICIGKCMIKWCHRQEYTIGKVFIIDVSKIQQKFVYLN